MAPLSLLVLLIAVAMVTGARAVGEEIELDRGPWNYKEGGINLRAAEALNSDSWTKRSELSRWARVFADESHWTPHESLQAACCCVLLCEWWCSAFSWQRERGLRAQCDQSFRCLGETHLQWDQDFAALSAQHAAARLLQVLGWLYMTKLVFCFDWSILNNHGLSRMISGELTWKSPT